MIKIKYFFIILFILLESCTTIGIYIRNTDVHDCKVQYIIEFHKDTLIYKSKLFNSDSIISLEKGIKSVLISTGRLQILKNNKVIKYKGSFYIKKGVKNYNIYKTYINKDLKI